MKIILIAILLAFSMSLFTEAQQNKLDSLLEIIKTNNIKAPDYYKSLIEAGNILSENGQNDSAILIFDKALNIAGSKKDSSAIIEILVNKGICMDQKGAYKEAAETYFNALSIAERRKEKKLQAKVLINMGILNFNLQKGETAIEYYTKAQEISESIKDTIGIIRALNNIGNVSSTLFHDLKTAEKNFLRTVELGEKINYRSAVIVGYNNLTTIYCESNQLLKAEKTCLKTIDMSPCNPFSLYNMGSILHKMEKYNKTIIFYDSAFKFANNFPELMQVILKDKAEAYAEDKDFANAFSTYKEYTILKDSLHKTETDNHIKELDIKYQTANREKEIIKLSSQKEIQRYLVYFLLAALVLGAITSFNAYKNIRNKKKIADQSIEIQQQKIRELEKDKQILATHAVLEGEEKERSRLARDLHDGLGGLLSGVKLKLSNLKGYFVISNDGSEQLEHAVDLLDNSIRELRRVAHNMMPEALIKFGLKDALSDFCNYISTEKKLNLNFNSFGEYKRSDQTLEITIYRIALELINNALKHSEASEIDVQLIFEEKRIYLTIQDNGKGFDLQKVDVLTSSGLKNIKARVESFNGRIDIDSQPGKGTEIGIEFSLG